MGQFLGGFGGASGSSSVLTAFTGGLWTPLIPLAATGNPGFNDGKQLDASGEIAAFIFTVPKTGTLDQAEFKLGPVSVAPLNGIRVSFQDLGATTGDPDATQDQYRDVTAGLTASAWVTPGLMTSDGTDTGAKRSVTIGQKLAVVVEFTSFTAGNDLSVLNGLSGGANDGLNHVYYMDHKTGGTWAKARQSCSVALKYNDGTYAFVGSGSYPYSTITTETYASDSNPDERGLYFSFPVAVKVAGAWVRGSLASDCDIVLYDTDGTSALATVSVDKDMTTKDDAAGTAFVWFAAPITLTASGNYRLVLKPTGAGANVTMYAFTVAAVAMMDAIEGGQAWQWTQRVDAGSWAQTTTKRPFMGLLVTSVHSG